MKASAPGLGGTQTGQSPDGSSWGKIVSPFWVRNNLPPSMIVLLRCLPKGKGEGENLLRGNPQMPATLSWKDGGISDPETHIERGVPFPKTQHSPSRVSPASRLYIPREHLQGNKIDAWDQETV